MPTTYFNLFKLTVEPKDKSPYQTFDEILKNDPIKPVTIAKAGNPINLEGKIKTHDELFSGTFCLIQKNEIPTKARVGKEPEPLFSDDDDAGLGHYTSFIYDPSNAIIAIQSNRNGVSANGIATYFRRNYKVKEIELEVVINPDELTKVSKLSKISAFRISIAKPQNGSFISDAKKKSIAEINSIADKTNANTMSLTVTMGYEHQKSLKRSTIFNVAKALLAPDLPYDVKTIEIKGKESDEDYVHTIDLINNKATIPVAYKTPKAITSRFLNSIVRMAIENYLEIKPKIDSSYKVKRNSQ